MKNLMSIVALLLAFNTFAQKTYPTFVLNPTSPASDIGSTVEVQVLAKNCTDISGFQYSIKWDAARYEFVSLKDLAISGLTPASFVATKNSVAMVWTTPTGNNIAFTENSSIFTIVLKSLKKDWVKDICFAAIPVDMEVVSGLSIVTAKFEGLDCSFTTGTNDLLENKAAKAFPNPFSNQLNLDLNVAQSQNATVLLVDMLGKMVFSTTKNLNEGQQNITIDVENIPNGAYTYMVKMADGILTGRVVKQ